MAEGSRRVLIVVPAYNEQESVAGVVREVFSALPDVTVLVVNDGSRDHTSSRARAAGATVVDLPFNLGVGGAMRLGFRFALEHDFDCVVQVDADGQHDPREIRDLLSALPTADLVIGARFSGKGDYAVQGPRRWAMRSLARILSRSSRTKLTDTTSGFRASGPRAIRLFAEHYPAEYLGDTVESLVIAIRAGLNVVQVPAAMRARQHGTSSQGPLRAAVFLARLALAVFFAFARPKTRLEEVED